MLFCMYNSSHCYQLEDMFIHLNDTQNAMSVEEPENKWMHLVKL